MLSLTFCETEWKSKPDSDGVRYPNAASRAVRTNSVRIWSAIDHPTTFRENKSIMTARYNQPSAVQI